MIRTQVQLTEAQVRQLRELAIERGSSVADLVRHSVDLFVRSVGLVEDEELRRRALAAVGRFRSGQSDLATEHDRYLPEAYTR